MTATRLDGPPDRQTLCITGAAAAAARDALARRPAPVAPRVLTLRRKSSGQEVARLQRELVAHGAELEVDGRYGAATEAAVRAYQVSREIAGDPLGVAGLSVQQALGTEVLLGIDVSSHQGVIDWHAVAASGVGWCGIKASQYRPDPRVRMNVDQSGEAGLARLGYHYAVYEHSVRENVDTFLRSLGGRYALELPPVLDQETGTAEEVKAGLWPPAAQRNLRRWTCECLDEMAQRTGRRPLLYTSQRRLRTYLAGGDGLEEHGGLWLVMYTTSPDPGECGPWSEWDLWQHTSKGRVRYDVAGIRPGATSPEALDVNWMAGGAMRRLRAS